MIETIIADLTDKTFSQQPGAVLVYGSFGQPYMDQFPGVGPSPRPFSMMAIEKDGIVYIPDPDVPRHLRIKSSRLMIAAKHQPPAGAIKKA